MEITRLLTEGDINFTEERQKWNREITDPLTQQILADHTHYFIHQSMSTPCLDALESGKGSGMQTTYWGFRRYRSRTVKLCRISGICN